MSTTKTTAYLTKLRAIEKNCHRFERLTELSKELKLDYALLMQLKESGILTQGSNGKWQWNDKIPVSTTLADTMFVKCRTYYKKKAQEKPKTKKAKKISMWKRFKNWLRDALS